MRYWLVVLALLLGATMPCSVGYAYYGHENELVNPCFEDGGDGWEYSPNVLFGAYADRPHTAYDPPGLYGEAGYLRQIVDDSLFSGWNPELNHKVGLLTFWLYTTGPAYVQVGFDWWDRITDPRPIGFSDPDYHYEVLPQEFQSEGAWTQVSVPFDWAGKPGNNQPRWVSIEIYFFGCTQTGFEAAVDDMSFTAQCIPEPSSLIVLLGGLFSAGFVVRKRH